MVGRICETGFVTPTVRGSSALMASSSLRADRGIGMNMVVTAVSVLPVKCCMGSSEGDWSESLTFSGLLRGVL